MMMGSMINGSGLLGDIYIWVFVGFGRVFVIVVYYILPSPFPAILQFFTRHIFLLLLLLLLLQRMPWWIWLRY